MGILKLSDDLKKKSIVLLSFLPSKLQKKSQIIGVTHICDVTYHASYSKSEMSSQK